MLVAIDMAFGFDRSAMPPQTLSEKGGNLERIDVQNVGQPGKTYRVDKSQYTEMRNAMLSVLPDAGPRMNVPDVIQAVLPKLSERLFPGGETSSGWVKCVQLDPEAKAVIRRTPSPVRRWRVQ